MRVRKTLTPVAAATLQQALQVKSCNLDDLVAISELAKPTIARYITDLRGAGMVRVAGWDRDPRGYPTIPRYQWGSEPDALKTLTTRTAAARMRDLRAARKLEEVK